MKQTRTILAPHWSSTPLVHILQPMQKFIQQSQASGIVLFAMTIIALIIANSSLSETYLAVLDTHLALTAGPFALDYSMLHWINDGLMAIFFFMVGLEIKREILVGEWGARASLDLPEL